MTLTLAVQGVSWCRNKRWKGKVLHQRHCLEMPVSCLGLVCLTHWLSFRCTSASWLLFAPIKDAGTAVPKAGEGAGVQAGVRCRISTFSLAVSR